MAQKQTTLGIGRFSTDTLETELDAIIGALTPLRLSRWERATIKEIAAGECGEVDPIEQLFYIADRHCPDYCYVGPRGSDGLGVWPVLDFFDS